MSTETSQPSKAIMRQQRDQERSFLTLQVCSGTADHRGHAAEQLHYASHPLWPLGFKRGHREPDSSKQRRANQRRDHQPARLYFIPAL
jgi:hypothetical protein